MEIIAMIARTIFDSDYEMFRDSVRRFLEAEAEPFHEQWEKDGQLQFPTRSSPTNRSGLVFRRI